MRALEGLQPERVFYYFEEISKIPRGSYHEKAISDYLVGYAKEHGIIYYQDELYNVVMQVPASEGRENEEPIILQGHMDMVCEVRPGVDKDMEAEGLELYVEGDYVRAKDTTLGGDDGIAVAYMLAIADDQSISHPPLEYIITVSEEVGMEGANGIDLSMLRGHRMLNLDSEEEGIFLSSCAGGVSAHVTIPVSRNAIGATVCDEITDAGFSTGGAQIADTVLSEVKSVAWYQVSVSGLVGGHSGTEIDKGRANANKVLGRVLYELLTEVNFCIADISGGKKDNAIPIQAQAVIGINDSCRVNETDNSPADTTCSQVEKAERIISKVNSVLKNEYSVSDHEIHVELKRLEKTMNCDDATNTGCEANIEYKANIESESNTELKEVLDQASRDKVITYLMNVPDGIQNMSMSVPGLVETSLNLGILELRQGHLFAQHAVRSSVTTRKEYVVKQLEALTTSLGGQVTLKGSYPAWEYRADSPVREKVIELYDRMYGEKPVVEGIHAGLECGLLAAKLPDLDCVAMGPNIYDIHTYNERLSISSTKRVYEFLIEYMKK